MRRTIRRRSSSVCIDRRSGAERLEDRRGDRLRPAADLVHGPDTRGAARAAPAARQDVEAPREQVREDLEYPLREPDPAGMAVVELDGRLEPVGFEQPAARGLDRVDRG